MTSLKDINNINKDAIGPLIESAKNTFRSGHLFWPKKRNHISFICGKAPQDGDSFRNSFLSYNESLLEKERLAPILAEVTFNNLVDLDNKYVFNLAELEKLIANVADSIIIFIESPGSMAEAGFFAALPDIAAKSIVITPFEHQGNSFINIGPVAILVNKTVYKPGQFQIMQGQENVIFPKIMSTLQPYIKERTHRQKLTLKEKFKELSIAEQFYLLRELVYCFSPLSREDIHFLLNEIFGHYDKDIVSQCIAVLSAIEGGVYLTDDQLFAMPSKAGMLLEYNGDELRSNVLLFYGKHLQERHSVKAAL